MKRTNQTEQQAAALGLTPGAWRKLRAGTRHGSPSVLLRAASVLGWPVLSVVRRFASSDQNELADALLAEHSSGSGGGA
jgi:hypothetical protein